MKYKGRQQADIALNAIGLMSGTSLDGIDVALLRSDGKNELERGPFLTVPYSDEFREKLAQSLQTALKIQHRGDRPGNLSQIEIELTDLHADAVMRFLDVHSLRASDIDLVGFHGQTVLHKPDIGLTVQLGDGPRLANKLGMPVVYDMRANDAANGGQGAPLAPAYHQALSANLDPQWSGLNPVCFVNIGGISNLTYIDGNNPPHAFDCGTGNVLIDQWVYTHNGISYDEDGLIGSRGQVDLEVANQYIKPMAQKLDRGISLDRLDFEPLKKGVLSLEDGARTLAYITAQLIAKSQDRLPSKPKLWVLSGGGRLNKTIVSELHEALDISPNSNESRIIKSEDLAISGDAVEAEAWGYLAIRSVKGLPLTYPTTTGVSGECIGGVVQMPTENS
ncbi:MAG: anhydro-N-acetylmuramic acid kinase [Lentilitoribacter sp.]